MTNRDLLDAADRPAEIREIVLIEVVARVDAEAQRVRDLAGGGERRQDLVMGALRLGVGSGVELDPAGRRVPAVPGPGP